MDWRARINAGIGAAIVTAGVLLVVCAVLGFALIVALLGRWL
jgi:hypothetical protein